MTASDLLAENERLRNAIGRNLIMSKTEPSEASYDSPRVQSKRLREYALERFPGLSVPDHSDPITALCDSLDAARATLAAVRELAEKYREYGTHPTLDPDDGKWAILRADLVAESLLAILDAPETECASCGEGTEPNECPKSKRPCGHHWEAE